MMQACPRLQTNSNLQSSAQNTPAGMPAVQDDHAYPARTVAFPLKTCRSLKKDRMAASGPMRTFVF
jgi:hypothetical protein